jgi:YHS domain-containing protein
MIMKTIIKVVLATVCAVAVMVSTINTANAADSTQSKEKVKPYTLDYCIVSGEKLGGSMGKPHTITYQGREIKFCCPGCEGVFKKDPEKYIKKIEQAEKEKSKSSKQSSPHSGHQQ